MSRDVSPDMWSDARRLFAAHRDTLAAHGIALSARLEADEGLMCSYADGVVRLALPDPATADGHMRAAIIAALLGIEVGEVAWMFRAQLARLVGHEIGHALRDQYGTVTPDPWREEQAAERFANALCRPHIDAATRAALRDLLAGVVERLGGLGEAAACHRSPRARAWASGSPPSPETYRDLTTFLRVAVAWGYLDLILDEEDDLHACCTDLLLAA